MATMALPEAVVGNSCRLLKGAASLVVGDPIFGRLIRLISRAVRLSDGVAEGANWEVERCLAKGR